MTLPCTRCDSTGFLNIEQLPESVHESSDFVEDALQWIQDNADHDVTVCDCCGDGEGWYGDPGEHYGPNDPPGRNGPYDANGGLCRCH